LVDQEKHRSPRRYRKLGRHRRPGIGIGRQTETRTRHRRQEQGIKDRGYTEPCMQLSIGDQRDMGTREA